MDPCYYNTGKLTRESDVYAFGVVLFEVLSGRKAVDRSFDDEEQWSLAGWAQEQIKQGKGKVDRIIDPRLMGQISKKCLKEFASLAGHCLHTQPKNRPTMTEVVMKLKSILSQELKSKSDNSVIDEEGFIKKLRSIFKGKVNAAATGTKSALIQLDAANRKNTNQNTSKS
ncbi:unnamed protein product [Lactuca virosa]|uniref:Protein kinase domain-containing protein n=1 Tax=Lactuca virosa TaxID=75947 RepID=A0AAU9P4B9_9ASTR|nr:unnamed protein product [Lactuca virosa]